MRGGKTQCYGKKDGTACHLINDNKDEGDGNGVCFRNGQLHECRQPSDTKILRPTPA